MEDVRWPAKQLEEHRLEISNRIRNLFWTVSGDYDMEFEPDTEKYVYSKQTVLYEAVKQGAFARYFDQKKLGMYLMKKLHFSAGEDMLLPLTGLCMDAAAFYHSRTFGNKGNQRTGVQRIGKGRGRAGIRQSWNRPDSQD